ncbi:MAG TPA: hypothetical protein VNH18_18120 [Bryobacteraceae bacterium]|nr:hypothetical protein [Bryobacteraceae bacterium]
MVANIDFFVVDHKKVLAKPLDKEPFCAELTKRDPADGLDFNRNPARPPGIC